MPSGTELPSEYAGLLSSAVRVHPWCGRPYSEHPPQSRVTGAACPFPAQPPVEFAVDTEPRVRVCGIPDPANLPPLMLEVLDDLARTIRAVYGIGVEVTAEDDLDEVRAALDTIRRRLDP